MSSTSRSVISADVEYSLLVALNLMVCELCSSYRELALKVYRTYRFATPGSYCCRRQTASEIFIADDERECQCEMCENREMRDHFSEVGCVLMKVRSVKNERITKRYTLFHDMYDEIDIAEYYFVFSRTKIIYHCSNGFVVLTQMQLTDDLKKSFAQHRSIVSKLFQNSGLVVQLASSQEVKNTVALMINRFILSKIIELINVRYGKEREHEKRETNEDLVNQQIRQSMMLHCQPISYSLIALTGYVQKHVPYANVKSIVFDVFQEYSGYDTYCDIVRFETLKWLKEFIFTFRLACNQPSLSEIQSSIITLLKSHEEIQRMEADATEVYNFLRRSITERYRYNCITWGKKAKIQKRFLRLRNLGIFRCETDSARFDKVYVSLRRVFNHEMNVMSM